MHDSDEKSTGRKHKRSSPERKSRDRESSYKKSRSRRDRSEERNRSSYDASRRRRSDGDRRRSGHHHNSRDDYNERRYRSDKHRHNDHSSRRDDRERRRRDDSGDRSYKNRSNTDRSSGGYSESDKYKRSNRDEKRRRRRSRSRSGSEEKRDKRYRSHSKSKEKESSEVISKRSIVPPTIVPAVISTTTSVIDKAKEKSKSPEISAVLAPPINNVNPVAAERKLAKLDQLGITLHANSLTATSSTPGGVKLPEGVEIPAYYNPNAINVTKYAEQIQKRKLLWSSKKTEPVAATSTWNKATFSQDTDGKVASKFMRLMGIKDGQAKPQPEPGENDLDKQKKLFSTMEQQYEVARQVTHTMRGVGLGFGSQPRQF